MDGLQSRMKNDFEDNDTKDVRLALKELGVKTKIPHKVAKNAILHSKLYSIDFLQKIIEYISDKFNKDSKQTGIYVIILVIFSFTTVI